MPKATTPPLFPQQQRNSQSLPARGFPNSDTKDKLNTVQGFHMDTSALPYRNA